MWSACGLVLLASLALACGAVERQGKPQRVVLITLDTLRYDSFAKPAADGSWLMPAMRALAARGLDFDNFYASTSTTQPSHASLFTGLAPWAHGVTRNGMLLAPELPSLTEEFQRAGFATHAVVSSFPLEAQFGFARGFDHFEDEFDVPYVRTWEGRSVEEGRFFSLAQSVTRRAIGALDNAPEGDQFFWFHYFDPHDPYGDSGPDPMGVGQLLGLARGRAPGAEMDAALAQARRLYELDVRAMDSSLAGLFARLEVDSEHYETHLIITADHGESFGELGAIGHGKRVTREQVQVPLLVLSPGLAAGGEAQAAGMSDLGRTMLALAGVETAGFPGRNLLDEGPPAAYPVLGMRRSFDKPKTEVTSTGEEFELPEVWFYRVDGRRLVSGNGQRALLEGDRSQALEGQSGKKFRAEFRALELLLAAGPEAIELTDEAVQGALGALGYVDREE